MQSILSAVSLAILVASVVAHGHHVHEDQVPLDYVRFPFEPIYRGSGGEGEYASISVYHTKQSSFILVTADAVFSGITTFAKLPWVQCLTRERHVPFDIAFIGAPFVCQGLRNAVCFC
jgi:agmatinase